MTGRETGRVAADVTQRKIILLFISNAYSFLLLTPPSALSPKLPTLIILVAHLFLLAHFGEVIDPTMRKACKTLDMTVEQYEKHLTMREEIAERTRYVLLPVCVCVYVCVCVNVFLSLS